MSKHIPKISRREREIVLAGFGAELTNREIAAKLSAEGPHARRACSIARLRAEHGIPPSPREPRPRVRSPRPPRPTQDERFQRAMMRAGYVAGTSTDDSYSPTARVVQAGSVSGFGASNLV